MKIERRTAGNVTLLALTGEFDAGHLPTVTEMLDALVRGGHTRLVFNLRSLQFRGSPVLGYMIRLPNQVKDLHGELVISEPPQVLESTFKAFGVERIVRVFPTDEEAVRYFRDAGEDGEDTAGVPARPHPQRPTDGAAAPEPPTDSNQASEG